MLDRDSTTSISPRWSIAFFKSLILLRTPREGKQRSGLAPAPYECFIRIRSLLHHTQPVLL